MVQSVTPYDDFAWFYDRYWNEEFHSLAFPILERLSLARVPAPSRILDVCCGTGYLAGMLTSRGYHVTGIDASPSMIRHARENSPDAEFRICDATRFHFAPHFDAAFCTFDSLNHLLTPEHLESAFRNIAAALKPGAPVAFDMLREEAYQTNWGESFALVRDDHVLTITGSSYDFRTRVASLAITMFRLVEGSWTRSDTSIRERYYLPEEIDAALISAGFGEILCHDAAALGMGSPLGAGRTFFVATRS